MIPKWKYCMDMGCLVSHSEDGLKQEEGGFRQLGGGGQRLQPPPAGRAAFVEARFTIRSSSQGVKRGEAAGMLVKQPANTPSQGCGPVETDVTIDKAFTGRYAAGHSTIRQGPAKHAPPSPQHTLRLHPHSSYIPPARPGSHFPPNISDLRLLPESL